MGRFKDAFMYWQENVATDEELRFSFEEQARLAAEWQTEYHEWLDEQHREYISDLMSKSEEES
jgi:uncharacterized protein YeaO (DUF488 family)